MIVHTPRRFNVIAPALAPSNGGGDTLSRHDKIRASYKKLGDVGTMYDGIVTRLTLLGKVMDSLIWGLDEGLAAKWINDALTPIPGDFAGRLLEVPIGTGVLTMPLYKELAGADLTCLDYSADMMRNAERRADAMDVRNIRFVQGDVGALPFEDESFDIVLSLNGFWPSSPHRTTRTSP